MNQILSEKYDSILKVIQSISISLFLLQINYNKYLKKVICFLGPLIFGIYLIHNNYLIKQNILKYSFDNEPENISVYSAIILIIFKSFKIFISCILIDYFRNILFILLRLRNFCIFLEYIIRKIFYSNF